MAQSCSAMQSGDELRLAHQAGAEAAALHPVGGTADVQVDLVIAEVLPDPRRLEPARCGSEPPSCSATGCSTSLKPSSRSTVAVQHGGWAVTISVYNRVRRVSVRCRTRQCWSVQSIMGATERVLSTVEPLGRGEGRFAGGRRAARNRNRRTTFIRPTVDSPEEESWTWRSSRPRTGPSSTTRIGGLGQARGVHPWMAAERRHVGLPARPPGRAWRPRHRLRPARLRPVRAALDGL